ncbi:MAG: HD domain-containing protein [Candidatus Dojkabacteria bacterium]|jgi:poly(A) polymerase/tRNA nucleotidyltransferase (CCA-adding enzyme)|nr:HD domain-containing protein [Candidatus Dojkabacteria bacterium]
MKLQVTIPDYVQKVAKALVEEGFECYLVGGAIKDMVLGNKPHDYDLATDALPDEMINIFPKSVATGAKFGTILALTPDSKGEIHEVEVTTFRSEAGYVDGRWPSEVEFVVEIDKDLGRRDFTFNAMAIDLSVANLDGSIQEQILGVYDPFNGLTDLNLKVVRAVGTPIERFKEDGLRAMRACRLASQLEFEIEEETLQAIKKSIPVVEMVSMERIRDEFMKLLLNSPKPSKGINLLKDTGLLGIFLPELLETVGVEQKLFHKYDVYEHSLRTCDIAEDSVKLVALLHDLGKVRTDTKDGHFYGHDSVGAEIAGNVMERLKFPKEEIEKAKKLIENHMFYYPHITEDMEESEKERVKLNEWSDAAVRRFLRRVGEENIDDLFRLRLADAMSNPSSEYDPKEIAKLQAHISEVLQQDMALKISDLRITGDDLAEIGIERGPMMGQILEKLLDIVIEDPLRNKKEYLLEEAEKMM